MEQYRHNWNEDDARKPDEIVGVTKEDAKKMKEDIYKVLADKKFDKVRSLIGIEGKKIMKIDAAALAQALEGVQLSPDEKTYIDMLTNTINSEDVHKVEYLEYTDNVSSEGSNAMVEYLNIVQAGFGDETIRVIGKITPALITGFGGDGFTVPTSEGIHSFIISGIPNVKSVNRAVTSSHEAFGHGIPLVKKMTPSENNANAIRTDNLIRKILGLPQRDGSNHAGFVEGHITEPQKLPISR